MDHIISTGCLKKSIPFEISLCWNLNALLPCWNHGCVNTIDITVITSQLHCFQLRTILNGIDFKFVSHGLWSEKQNILRQHMHKKEFWILTNKCGNKLKHENEAFVFKLIFTFNSQNPKFFFMHVFLKNVLP
jgi:hypothetical protein